MSGKFVCKFDNWNWHKFLILFIQKQQTFDSNNETPNRMKVPYTFANPFSENLLWHLLDSFMRLRFRAFTITKQEHNNCHRVRLFCVRWPNRSLLWSIRNCFFPHLNNEEGKSRNWSPYEKDKIKPFSISILLILNLAFLIFFFSVLFQFLNICSACLHFTPHFGLKNEKFTDSV